MQHVLGCLWPVAAPVAELFFLQFYKALEAGEDMPIAFHSAQLAARAAYREYRDWGAFYFMGPCLSTEPRRVS